VDLGTATEDPNGKYDPGQDIALEGFWGGDPGTSELLGFGKYRGDQALARR
jgi:hypothetical protein